MPVGKYYCDHCDKYLQDTPSARKRHHLALSHQRARSLWYQSFSSTPPAPPLAICHHFVRTVRWWCRSSPPPSSFFLLPRSLSLAPLSQFFHWFHFSVSSLIILFDFSTFSLPKGFCQYGDACKYFHPPPAQPVPGLSSLPLSACSTQLSFFPLNIMQLLSIIDLYMFPQTHCQTTSIF